MNCKITNLESAIKTIQTSQDFVLKKYDDLQEEIKLLHDENKRLAAEIGGLKKIAEYKDCEFQSSNDALQFKTKKINSVIKVLKEKSMLDEFHRLSEKLDMNFKPENTDVSKALSSHALGLLAEFVSKSLLDSELSPINGDTEQVNASARHTNFIPLSTPDDKDLSKKLSSWLQKKGKSIENYSHLRCFVGHHHAPKVQKKTPSKKKKTSTPITPSRTKLKQINNLQDISIIVEEEENSRGDLTVVIENDVPDQQLVSEEESTQSDILIELNEENLKEITINALGELRTLIQYNYPWESCQEWLSALRRRNPNADNLPEYWECIASLEEVQGEMQMAVDSYQRAIMRGAKVDHIDRCLDSLFEKMSSLNLECQPYTPKLGKKISNVDAKNIFKSTVIQFALMLQKVKTFSSDTGVSANTLNYIATPVRRGTRSSLSRLNTPQKCTDSLKDLVTEENDKITFKTNKALLFDD